MPLLKLLKYSFFFSVLLTVVACDPYTKISKSSDYELKLQKAGEYYGKGNYLKASTLYEELIPVYKGTEKAEEIYYYFAYCNYYMADYSLAQFHFKNFVRSFPNSTHAEECLYMNAYCYYLNSPYYTLDQTDTKNAVKELQAFIDLFPESRRLDTCNILMDKLREKLEHKAYDIAKQYFKLSDYKAAITACKAFPKEFPDSHYLEELAYVNIESYYLLATNSVESKKLERLNTAIESYLKFVDLYPNGAFIQRAESVYDKSVQLKNSFINHHSN